jgi:hypothetical protein
VDPNAKGLIDVGIKFDDLVVQRLLSKKEKFKLSVYYSFQKVSVQTVLLDYIKCKKTQAFEC